VERLRRLALSLHRVRIEHAPPLRREDQSALALAQINQINETVLLEAFKGVTRKIEVVFRHDAERTNGGQSAAVFAVKLIDSVPVNDQLPRGEVQGSAEAPGVSPRRSAPGRAGILVRSPDKRPSSGFSPRADTTQRGRSRPERLLRMSYASENRLASRKLS
jgi:hypothetical protein